eukprot:TRINITY_DN27397_c0_g1_i2.p1 TRINITY_DN27397_c0_g1~~TRINITY_DN27397_c0_g1_i2.p1  ORF type:complete len:491 (-),score=68.01 TRINITY_DN27397_c0_g1_i2:16-1281(-)
MGDFIRSPQFAGTLRENVSRYFGVPLERQAIYDDDGLLTTCADFSRALQKAYPKLYVYDTDQMGPELRAKAMDELRQLDAEVEQSWRQFGSGAKAASQGLVSDSLTRSREASSITVVERSYEEGGSGGPGWQRAESHTVLPAAMVPSPACKEASSPRIVAVPVAASPLLVREESGLGDGQRTGVAGTPVVPPLTLEATPQILRLDASPRSSQNLQAVHVTAAVSPHTPPVSTRAIPGMARAAEAPSVIGTPHGAVYAAPRCQSSGYMACARTTPSGGVSPCQPCIPGSQPCIPGSQPGTPRASPAPLQGQAAPAYLVGSGTFSPRMPSWPSLEQAGAQVHRSATPPPQRAVSPQRMPTQPGQLHAEPFKLQFSPAPSGLIPPAGISLDLKPHMPQLAAPPVAPVATSPCLQRRPQVVIRRE